MALWGGGFLRGVGGWAGSLPPRHPFDQFWLPPDLVPKKKVESASLISKRHKEEECGHCRRRSSPKFLTTSLVAGYVVSLVDVDIERRTFSSTWTSELGYG